MQETGSCAFLMENYETKLLALNPAELDSPSSHIPFGELVNLVSIETTEEYETAIKALATNLPYETLKWPNFTSTYVDDWFKVEVDVFNRQLLFCERGSCQSRQDCDNLIDLSYHVLNIVSPSFTRSASQLSKGLDNIGDQRLLIWLRMSSEIYYSYYDEYLLRDAQDKL